MKLTAPAYIENGKLHLYDRRGLADAVAKMQDGPCSVYVKPEMPGRTLQQLRYYWGVVVANIRGAISDLHGAPVDSEQVHQLLKHKFFFEEVIIESTGEVLKVPRSIADNSDADIIAFSQYIETCIMWAWDTLNIAIPEAEKVAVVE